ncbi:uncharacterized protein LOC122747104 [Dromiciops gliroides]|uniref:uncharacterized protein LOC122747104 n=1 Tax=Dromiciops gliroides TaxID=33562 RepID=UPI001CC52179|nr:uncharacterized protein LOC122747104 [Dromiciops gliroides]
MPTFHVEAVISLTPSLVKVGEIRKKDQNEKNTNNPRSGEEIHTYCRNNQSGASPRESWQRGKVYLLLPVLGVCYGLSYASPPPPVSRALNEFSYFLGFPPSYLHGTFTASPHYTSAMTFTDHQNYPVLFPFFQNLLFSAKKILPSDSFKYLTWSKLEQHDVQGDQLRCPRVREGPSEEDLLFRCEEYLSSPKKKILEKDKWEKWQQENWEECTDLGDPYQADNLNRILRRLIRVQTLWLVDNSLTDLSAIRLPRYLCRFQ